MMNHFQASSRREIKTQKTSSTSQFSLELCAIMFIFIFAEQDLRAGFSGYHRRAGTVISTGLAGVHAFPSLAFQAFT